MTFSSAQNPLVSKNLSSEKSGSKYFFIDLFFGLLIDTFIVSYCQTLFFEEGNEK